MSGRILCDVGGHALSENFPSSENWAYCCDCQSFSPLSLGADTTAAHACVACDREFVRFYLCDTCRVVCAESEEPTRRKAFFLPVQRAPQPSCPGCLAVTNAPLRTHNCTELGISLATLRLVCLFCDDEIGDPLSLAQTGDEESNWSLKDGERAVEDVLPFGQAAEGTPGKHEKIVNAHSQAATVLCSQCGAEGSSEESFCQNCGHRLSLETRNVSVVRDAEEHRADSQEMLSPTSRSVPQLPKYLKRLIIAVVVIAAALIAAVAVRISTWNSVESQLDKAISRRAFLTPPGENAYDLYHQLKQEGVSASRLAAYDQKLLPLLAERPNQLLADLANPEKNAEMSTAVWEESTRLLTWASEIKPQDKGLAARAAYCQGRVAYLNQDNSSALQDWKRGSELDTTWALPANHAGLVYTERREFAQARLFFYEAIKREPQWAIPYNNVGTSFYYEKNYVKAQSYYEQARDRSPRWARPHAWLGDIAMRRADYDRAIQEFEAVLNLATTDNSSIKLDDIKKTLEEARQKAAATRAGLE